MMKIIFNALEPIAKDIIDAYVVSAITNEYSPKKTENPCSAPEITKSIIRSYYKASEMDSNKDAKNGSHLIDIQYKGDIVNHAIQQQEEDTLYSLAKKKKYKYNF